MSPICRVVAWALLVAFGFAALGCGPRPPNRPSASNQPRQMKESQEYWLRDRVNPGESEPNWDVYEQALETLDALPVWEPRDGHERFHPVGPWSYQGPNNMDPPQRRYWGLGPVSGRISAIAYHPGNANIIYVGSGFGGLWRSTDGGVTFAPLSNRWDVMHVSSITVDGSTSPETVYVGTGDYAQSVAAYGRFVWMWRQGDGWTALGQSDSDYSASLTGRAIRRLLIDPANNQNLLAILGGNGAATGQVWRSGNGGTSWDAIPNIPVGDWSSGAVSIANGTGGRVWWVAGLVGGAPRLFRSFSAFSTSASAWEDVSTRLPAFTNGTRNVDLAVSPNDWDRVYMLNCPPAIGGAGQPGQIVRSDNGSFNLATFAFADVTNNFPNLLLGTDPSYNWSQGFYDFHITVADNGANDTVYVGLIDLAASTDSGATWQAIGLTSTVNAIIHNDQHSAAVHPTNPNQVLIGCDGSLYRCTFNPGSGTWSFTNMGGLIGVSQFYFASFHPSDSARMIGGLQDNGTATTTSPLSNGNTALWDSVTAGDGGGCVINPTTPAIQYSSTQGGSVFRTTNSWTTSTTSNPNYGTTERTPFVLTMAVDPGHADRVYIGTQFLYRMTSGVWSSALGNQNFTGSNTSFVRSIAVAPSSSATIYLGTTNGRVWRSTNTGASWSRIDAGLGAAASVLDIDVHPTNPNDILVALGGTQNPGALGGQHLFRCANASVASPVFLNVGGGLPNVPVNTVERDSTWPLGVWYVGSDLGGHVTFDAGNTWANLSSPTGLPFTQVNQITAVPGTSKLMVATFGRGMWSINLGVPNFNISVDPEAVVGGDPTYGTVTLDQPAPLEGLTFEIILTGSFWAQAPATVTVPGGQTSATFTITTQPPNGQDTVNVTAKFGGTLRQTSFRILAYGVEFTTDKPGEFGGHYISLTGALNPSPTNGFDVQVTFSSSRPDLVEYNVNSAVLTQSSSYAFSNTVLLKTLVSELTYVDLVATCSNGASFTYTVLIHPYEVSFSVGGTEVWGGNYLTCSLALNHHTGAIPVPIELTSPQSGMSTGFGSENRFTFGPGGYQHVEGWIRLDTMMAGDAEATWTATHLNSSESQSFMRRRFDFVVQVTEPKLWGGHHSEYSVELESASGDIPVDIVISSSQSGVTLDGSGAPQTISINGGRTIYSGSFRVPLVDTDRVMTLTGTHLTGSASDTLQLKRYQATMTYDNYVVPSGEQYNALVTLDHPTGDFPVNVNFASNDAAIAPAFEPISIAGGLQSGGAGPKIAGNVTSPKYVTLYALIFGGDDTEVITVIPGGERTIGGRVTFGDYSGPTIEEATFELRDAGATTIRQTQTVPLAADGSFTLEAWSGAIDVSIKRQPWLRRKISVNTTSGNVTGANLSVVNGDVNGDNSVGIPDFLQLRAAFGSSPGSPNWNPYADLNGNGTVNVADFLILRKNYGMSGAS